MGRGALTRATRATWAHSEAARRAAAPENSIDAAAAVRAADGAEEAVLATKRAPLNRRELRTEG